MTLTGLLVRRNDVHCYGWIDAGLYEQVFFHEANLPGETRKSRHRIFTKLVDGKTRLLFDLKETPKGLSAINVSVLPEGSHATSRAQALSPTDAERAQQTEDARRRLQAEAHEEAESLNG